MSGGDKRHCNVQTQLRIETPAGGICVDCRLLFVTEALLYFL